MTGPKSLQGIRVLEFSHTIMGPCAGLTLADLGADVVKVEPAPGGDHTRRLPGFAAGFFATFNRNKRGVAIDLKSAAGRAAVQRLGAGADRKRVVEGTRVSVRVDLGGRRIIKKKKK